MIYKGFVNILKTIICLNLTINSVIFHNNSYESMFLRNEISFMYSVECSPVYLKLTVPGSHMIHWVEHYVQQLRLTKGRINY